MKKELLLTAWIALSISSLTAQSSRLWSTYYGGAIYDVVTCSTTDGANNIYIARYTSSTSGIASGGYDTIYGGGSYDAFLAKFDSDGNRLWATYFGAGNNDYSYSLATDDSGNVYLAGGTSSNFWDCIWRISEHKYGEL